MSPYIKTLTDSEGNDVYPITKTEAVYDNQGKRLDNILSELKNYVSDGKKKVASAITSKGIPTAADATFDTMSDNIGKIETGITPSPQLIGTYTGNNTISVSAYKRATDTVANFIVEIASVNALNSTINVDKGETYIIFSGSNVTKALSGNNLTISGASFTVRHMGNGGDKYNTQTITYRVYHI